MELKEYQKEVLSDLRNYLDRIESGEPLGRAFASYWKEKGIDIFAIDKNRYLHPYDDSVRSVPNVTVKVPTAGGKTFIACNALRTMFEHFPSDKPRVVAWFVPSDEILRQTLRNLRNPEHPYRQRLDSLFHGNVHVLGKEEALMGRGISPVEVTRQVTVFVLSVSSFAANNKEARRSYRENENLAEYAEGASLMQVLSYLNPVVIVDESHNFEANLRVELLNAINPYCILNLTATPKQKSNIISFVDAIKLKRANMVKLPVIVYNHRSVNEVLVNAINLQRSLERRAKAAEEKSGKYIRPIVLFQAQPRRGEENVTYDRIRQAIIDMGVPEEQVRIKTGDRNELKDTDLMSRDCPVRFIITVDALKEGWDCPFAYVLASLANRTSSVSVEQILGRILRLPYTAKHPDDLLNISYVFTSSRDFSDTLGRIVESLNRAGFSRKDFRKKEVFAEEQDEALSDYGGLFSDSPDDGDDSLVLEEPGMPEFGSSRGEMPTAEASASAVELIEKRAGEAVEEYEEEISRQEADRNDMPNDLQDVVEMNGIKDLYAEVAYEMTLPRFVRRVEQESIFEEKYAAVVLDKSMLTEGFDLGKQDKNINFTLTETEAVRIDLGRVSSDDEFEVQRRDLGRREMSIIKEQFIGMPDENLRNNVARTIARRIKMDNIPEPALVSYVRDAVAGLDSEKIEDIFTRDILYADRVRTKLEGLLLDYRKAKFREMSDTREIFCAPVYKFPGSVAVAHECLGLHGGLYMKEGDMNPFEERVIRKVSECSNVLFWHRNPERSGFGINGFINHYPDFIVRMKSGAVVIIETKGDDRDNSDSRDKLMLGKAWANKAGEQYHYYMVFDNKRMEDAITVAELIERIRRL